MNPHSGQTALFKKLYLYLVTEVSKHVTSVLANRYQYYVVQLDTEGARDKGKKRLQLKKFISGDKEATIIVNNLGKGGNVGPHTYILSAGPTTTAKMISQAVNDKLRARNTDVPGYSIRCFTMNGKTNGMFYLTFEEGPKWDRCRFLELARTGETSEEDGC